MERSPLQSVLVIAGPTCVGKSTLARHLLNGAMPQLGAALGVTGGGAHKLVLAKEWRRGDLEPEDAVILHYELTRAAFCSRGASDGALTILDRARRVTFLTLWERPEEIRRRFRERIVRSVLDDAGTVEIGHAWRSLGRFRVRRPYVSRSDRMWQLYRRWFDFTARYDRSPHLVFRSTGMDQAPPVLPGSLEVPFWHAPEFLLAEPLPRS